jgi:hypothetical protein
MFYPVLYLQDLVQAGGPERDQYAQLGKALKDFNLLEQRGEFDFYGPDFKEDLMGKSLTYDTMQGFAYRKPYGHSGDFELLERIYGNYQTPMSGLKKWDEYWSSQPFIEAFQNTQRYFFNALSAAEQSGESLKVLNIASGSSRSVADYLKNNRSQSSFLCVDQSWQALDYARLLCRDFTDQVSFKQGSAGGLAEDKAYHLIWSEGLFDYLNDAEFKLTLEKLLSCTRAGGEIVIGNLSTSNSSQSYMDFLNWHVNPRSEAHLTYLATCCGVKRSQMHVVKDPSGVNLFLHIAR